ARFARRGPRLRPGLPGKSCAVLVAAGHLAAVRPPNRDPPDRRGDSQTPSRSGADTGDTRRMSGTTVLDRETPSTRPAAVPNGPATILAGVFAALDQAGI